MELLIIVLVCALLGSLASRKDGYSHRVLTVFGLALAGSVLLAVARAANWISRPYLNLMEIAIELIALVVLAWAVIDRVRRHRRT
ncbi:MAG: hypothetical protein KDC46_12290 [Thermoleophilia bacterium]|nr:hypothetical protein [Thermoleophilia bacterium]